MQLSTMVDIWGMLLEALAILVICRRVWKQELSVSVGLVAT